MKFALVPSSDELLNDKYFMFDTADNLAACYFSKGLRDSINAHGDEIHTIDMYEDKSEIDYCLLEWPRWSQISMLARADLLKKTIYCNAEPTSVLPMNCPEGYEKLNKLFPYILTWNSDWIDQKSIFKKNIPYPFTQEFGDVSFNEKKLATAITADKYSDTPGELYSERRAVYCFFEENYPDQFDFYGTRWDGSVHTGYKGTVEDKAKTYHNYKFAICLENTKGARDYVTEKIFDCLCAGIVPIYGGAPNILEYVPAECFIDYFSFESYEEMAQFLINMDEETYNGYLSATKNWLDTMDTSPYTIEKYVDYIYEAISHKKDFEVDSKAKMIAILKGTKESLRQILVDIKHKTIG